MAHVTMRDDAVGWRVQVYWEGEAEWYEGVVTEYDAENGYFVKYDDGEEQWEDESGETPIKFISKSGGGSHSLSVATESEQQQMGEWSQEPSSSHTDAYDDDADDSECRSQIATPKKSPTPEQDGSPISHHRHSKQQPRNPNLYVNNAVFFRDEETLREMKKTLQAEKKTLAHEYQTLAKQLVEKEHLSASLKRELQDLKIHVTLASVLGHASSATTSKGSRSIPKTSSDWSERVLDQKLQNKQLKQEVVDLKACVQQKQYAIQQRQKQCDQLKDKLGRVPRRDLCTLVDVEVEIAKLLEEKRALEAQKPKVVQQNPKKAAARKQGTNDGTFGWTNDADASKVALEKELGKLELACSRAKDEIHKWKLSFERENARILPLKARRITLQQELAKYEASQVLLRSVFLRLDPDSEGRVSAKKAVEALTTLAPADVSSATSEEITQRLTQHSLLDSEALAFSDFVACFNHLFKS